MKKVSLILSVVAMMSLLPLPMWSQNVTVTVGTGTLSTNTTPINSYYRHSWTECIYQASEIDEDGFIYGVAWECSEAYEFLMSTIEIYMGTTPNTTHANSNSWLPMDQLTLVYSGVNVTIPSSTGWLYIDLDDAFEYSSDENLVIVVAKTAPQWTSSLRFYATSSNSAVLYRRSDSSTDYASHPGTASGTLSSDLANVRLYFTSTNCPSARNITISNITTESALATWSGNPSNTSWLVGWGLSEAASQTNTIMVQDTFVLMDNLSSESQYFFSIQSVCDTVVNSHWKKTHFKTPCAGNYMSGGCFDLTNLSSPGIICQYGDFYNPYYHTGIAQNRHTVITELQYDPNTNYTLPTIPDCRDYSVRLGNDNVGAEAESISLSYEVDTMQADLILLQYAVVMEDPGHDPEDQPRFTMEILNSNNQLIDEVCGYDNFVASSGLGWSSLGGVIWNEWTTVGMDISAYHGQNVKVRMTTYDCEQSGHFGYAYFLLDCGSKRMKSDFCGLDTVRTFTAPAGFRYEWYWESNPDSIISVDRSVTFLEDYNDRIFCKVTSLNKDSCYFRIYGSLEPRYPIAGFSATVDNCTRTCVFQNESVVSADGITPNSYFEPCDNALWDFGDGTVSQQYNPTHVYSSPGTYQVMLVSGLHDFSCTDTAYYTVTIVPIYTYIDSVVCNSCSWNGAVYTQSGTYTYTTQSVFGCDSTVVLNLQVNPLPTAAISGLTILCADSAVVLTADSAYSYLWNTGDTTQSIIATEEGTYSLTVTNEYGCSAEATHQLSSLGNPIMSVTMPELCAGGTYTLSVGHQDDDNIHLGHGETTLSLSDTIYLPDGVYCDPFGCSYRSPLTFTAYADDATIQSVEDIYYVRLNIEHSYIGDLYINITCPNGQKADLMKYSDSGMSSCNSQIPSSSRGWIYGSNMQYYTYLGVAYDYDVASCDATAFGNEPGVGWNYCWSNNTTQGYSYATGDGGYIYRLGNEHNNSVDSSNVAAGTQFYHPDDSFTNLIGCPLNGDWYIEVQDGWSADNGYIFGWELALSTEALPSTEFEFDHSTASGPWLTTLSDSLFQITPPAGLSHDTTIAYTFTVYDTGGCAYDTTVYILVHAIPHTYIDSIVCTSCTWNGAIYTQSGTYTYTTQGVSGCDSIVVLNLIVSPPVTAAISGLTVLCADSAVVLTADSAYSYLWNTGDTTQSIIATEEGTYSLTVTNEYGCSAEATHQLSSLGNPIMSVTVPEMCAGGSYTLSVGHQDNDNIHLGQGETTLSLSDTIYLPDGVYCDPFGCSYRSPLTFTAYADDATIQSVEDIYYVRLNIEHSYIGDLYINITCPNGQKADLMKYGGSGMSSCNSQIPSSSRGWAYGSNMPDYTYLGVAHDYDVASCDATAFGNEPGVGWNYCWSNNTTQGYSYAAGAGGYIYRSGNEHNNSVDSSNVAAGTQFYHPDDSFTSLIGCPLNGDWYIEVQDGWSADNGYIFGWELALSTEALPSMDFELDYSTANGPWVTTLSDSLFQITPSAGLSHDTTIAYTFTVYDTGGCAYDTTVYILVHAIPHTEIDTAVCDVLTFGGISYTEAGQYTQTYTSVFGCDSIITLNLNILPPTDSTLVVTVMENNLPYQLNGSPYTTSGIYTQHLDNVAGCDSLLTLDLTVLYNVTNSVDTTVCADILPFTWYGHAYTAAGTHTNVLTAANGVDSTVTYTLNVDELSASVGNVTHVVCYGESTGAATVAVTGGQSPLSYQWTTAAGAGISTATSVSGCAAGSYTFTVTDQLGCSVTVPVTINTLNDSMQPGTIASDQEVCSGSEIAAFTGTSASGGDNSAYQWQLSTNETDWSPAPGSNTSQNYTYPDLSSESFWLRRAWISQSCGTVYSNTVMLTVLPVTHDTIIANVCQNNDYQGYGFDIPVEQTEQPGEYVFERVQTTGPCDTFFVLVLTVNPTYSTDISGEICEGGGYFAQGFNIPAQATVNVESLSQTLTLQSVHGCDSIVNLELSVTDTAVWITPLTTDFCETMSAELMVETAMADYVWSTGEHAPTITVTQPGIYSVTASQGGCQATANIRVENCHYELYLPNAITPSKGDGLNDYFSIPEYNQLGMDKFEISIFNRWGEQVYYSTDKNFKWYGEFRGQIHQEAIYNYIINYTDLMGKPHKVLGRITVL